MNPTPHSGQRSFSLLRAMVRNRTATERCDLCRAELAAEHHHLLDPETRQLLCSCNACAILFPGQQGTRYRQVPRRIQFLPRFQLSDEQWERLYLPIGLAWFVFSSPAERVIALYPGPAGATESLLPLDAWQDLVEKNPVLRDLEPDVEALLVNRMGANREYYRVPIDECYKLVGLIRTHWRGLGGGDQVHEEIGRFFHHLQERSEPGASDEHA